jgi:hypothetical protein
MIMAAAVKALFPVYAGGGTLKSFGRSLRSPAVSDRMRTLRFLEGRFAGWPEGHPAKLINT